MRAVLEGRVLILEGLEKAERNVLPILNNLLENREMQLDDGRFIMAAQRYDKLKEVSVTFSQLNYCSKINSLIGQKQELFMAVIFVERLILSLNQNL